MVRRTHTYRHTEREREREILFLCDNNRHKVNIGKSLR